MISKVCMELLEDSGRPDLTSKSVIDLRPYTCAAPHPNQPGRRCGNLLFRHEDLLRHSAKFGRFGPRPAWLGDEFKGAYVNTKMLAVRRLAPDAVDGSCEASSTSIHRIANTEMEAETVRCKRCAAVVGGRLLSDVSVLGKCSHLKGRFCILVRAVLTREDLAVRAKAAEAAGSFQLHGAEV